MLSTKGFTNRERNMTPIMMVTKGVMQPMLAESPVLLDAEIQVVLATTDEEITVSRVVDVTLESVGPIPADITVSTETISTIFDTDIEIDVEVE